MITGFINDELEPLLNNVFVRTKIGEVIPLKTILDTRFNASFCIPRTVIKKLGIPPLANEDFELADGTYIEEDIYIGEVVVDNQPYTVEITATDSDTALMRMEMLLEKEAIFNLKTMKVTVI